MKVIIRNQKRPISYSHLSEWASFRLCFFFYGHRPVAQFSFKKPIQKSKLLTDINSLPLTTRATNASWSPYCWTSSNVLPFILYVTYVYRILQQYIVYILNFLYLIVIMLKDASRILVKCLQVDFGSVLHLEFYHKLLSFLTCGKINGPDIVWGTGSLVQKIDKLPITMIFLPSIDELGNVTPSLKRTSVEIWPIVVFIKYSSSTMFISWNGWIRPSFAFNLISWSTPVIESHYI